MARRGPTLVAALRCWEFCWILAKSASQEEDAIEGGNPCIVVGEDEAALEPVS